MKIGLQDVDWGYVGAMLSRESDENQVRFFKAFVKEKSLVCFLIRRTDDSPPSNNDSR